MNYYRRGANVERAAVNAHIKAGAIFAGRFAASKCKGQLKVDVIAFYPVKKVLNKKSHSTDTRCFPATLELEQYKKSKTNNKKEREKFYAVDLPSLVYVTRNFIEVK